MTAYRQIRGKVEVTCDDMGQQSLKNIAERGGFGRLATVPQLNQVRL